MTRREALDILGLESDASPKEIKNAYRKLVKQYHPDKNPAHNAEAMFRLIHEAYQYLDEYDEDTRKQEEETQRQAEAKRHAEETRQQAEAKRHAEEAQRKAEESKRQQQAKRTIWYYCLSTWVLMGLYIISNWESPFGLLFLPFGPILLPTIMLISVGYIVSSNTVICLLVSPFITIIFVLSIGLSSYIAYLIINRSYELGGLLGLIFEFSYNTLIVVGIVGASVSISDTPLNLIVVNLIVILLFLGLSSYIIHLIKTGTWAACINGFILNPSINYTILALGLLTLIGLSLLAQVLFGEIRIFDLKIAGYKVGGWVIIFLNVVSAILLRRALPPKIGNPFFED